MSKPGQWWDSPERKATRHNRVLDAHQCFLGCGYGSGLASVQQTTGYLHPVVPGRLRGYLRSMRKERIHLWERSFRCVCSLQVVSVAGDAARPGSQMAQSKRV